MEQMKRRPPNVEPVVAGGTRYEVTRTAPDIAQRSGVLAAVDVKSGRRRWAVAVYPVTYAPGEEEDAQDVFITDLEISEDGRHLVVTNESGARFQVRMSDGAVEPIPES